MKKILAFILSLTLLGSMTAMADDSNRRTELKVTVNSGYTIVIPATLDITFGAETTNLPVEVTGLHLSGNYNALKVSVLQMMPLTNENGKLIWYTIDSKSSGAIRYFQQPETQNFVVGITEANWNKAPAGNYTTTVSFGVEFGNATSN